jgi:predicted lipoprotein with Yx(FWY)xxD motif
LNTFLKPLRASLVIVVLLLAAATVTAAARTRSSSAVASSAQAPTVRLEQTSIGKILVDRYGYTLYLFTRDRRGQDRCVNVSDCLNTWPALTTRHKPIAGKNIKHSLLGTIKLHGGTLQVTYAGHPLYTYAEDFGPGSTLNVGTKEYGGLWYAVSAAGRPVGGGGHF